MRSTKRQNVADMSLEERQQWHEEAEVERKLYRSIINYMLTKLEEPGHVDLTDMAERFGISPSDAWEYMRYYVESGECELSISRKSVPGDPVFLRPDSRGKSTRLLSRAARKEIASQTEFGEKGQPKVPNASKWRKFKDFVDNKVNEQTYVTLGEVVKATNISKQTVREYFDILIESEGWTEFFLRRTGTGRPPLAICPPKRPAAI